MFPWCVQTLFVPMIVARFARNTETRILALAIETCNLLDSRRIDLGMDQYLLIPFLGG